MASKKFLNPINLLNLASNPSSATEGDVYFNTTDDVIKVYANGAWIGVGENGGASTSSVYLVRNNTGSTILKGTLVSASGAEPSGRIDVEPFAAVGGINSEITVMGMATTNISNGVNGEVISFGTLTGLDTRGDVASAIAVGDETWAEGDILFAHPTVAGKLTKVRPQHDLAVAFITVRHASTGQIAVRIVPGNNHLEWMHDVLIDGTPADNEVLAYDSETGLWKNQTPTEAGLQVIVSDVSDTEIGYLDGVTSAIQTQIDGKSSTSHNHTINSLSNVVITEPSDNQLLAYDTTTSSFINQSAAAAGLLTPADVTDALSLYILSTAKGAVNGVASLDSSAFIPTSQIPDLSATYLTPTTGNLAYQPLDQDLTDIVALGSNGLLRKTNSTYSLDNSTYLTSYTETDPVFIASPAGGITSTAISNWNTAYGWGDHALENYAASSHNHSLDSLSNVVVTGTPSAGQVIVWDNSSAKWVNELLVGVPSQSTHGGKFLTTNGSSASWATIDLSPYLTTSLAASTYLQITSASTTYAPKSEPTFTGIVVLPSTTSIGDVSATEISYLDGVTSAIQTQVNLKASSSHTHSYQDADADLTAIAAITSGVGLLKRLGPDTWTIDTNSYITGSSPTISTSILSGTTTFNLVNSTATTINFGGAATTMIVGSNDLAASLTLRAPFIIGSATSQDLFNTIATTINFAGAATSLNIGGTPTTAVSATLFGNTTSSGVTKTINIGTGGASGSITNINLGSATGGATGTVSVYPTTTFSGEVIVPTPTISTHATTKAYVDALAAGINVKPQVVYVSQANLNATYANGTNDSSGGTGVGATLTGNVDGALILDGPEVESAQRVLIANQTNSVHNGIYVVTFAGDGDDPFILTRATNFNGNSSTNGLIKNGDYIFVTSGTISANDSYVVSQGGTSTTPSGAIKIGTDNIIFAQYSGVPSNISTLGYVTIGTWAATPIDKDFIDVEIARTNNPVFTGHVAVPAPVNLTDATNKEYVDDLIFASLPYLPDIIPLDDLRYEFNDLDSRFEPKFEGQKIAVNNPLRLLLTINGIIQVVDFPEYVWQSMLPREGFMIDSDGYIAFSEVPPSGSTFDARLMLGANVNTVKKGYPFKAVDILLGA